MHRTYLCFPENKFKLAWELPSPRCGIGGAGPKLYHFDKKQIAPTWRKIRWLGFINHKNILERDDWGI